MTNYTFAIRNVNTNVVKIGIFTGTKAALKNYHAKYGRVVEILKYESPLYYEKFIGLKLKCETKNDIDVIFDKIRLMISSEHELLNKAQNEKLHRAEVSRIKNIMKIQSNKKKSKKNRK